MKNKARFVNVNLELMVKDLNIKEVTLLSLIQSLAKKKGYCFATNEMLSESLGIHDRTLYRMLNKLEEGGHISRDTQSISNYGKERRIYLHD